MPSVMKKRGIATVVIVAILLTIYVLMPQSSGKEEQTPSTIDAIGLAEILALKADIAEMELVIEEIDVISWNMKKARVPLVAGLDEEPNAINKKNAYYRAKESKLAELNDAIKEQQELRNQKNAFIQDAEKRLEEIYTKTR